jgi:hypothetical protein
MKINFIKAGVFLFLLPATITVAEVQSIPISSSTLANIHTLEKSIPTHSAAANLSLTGFPEDLKFQISWGPVNVGWSSLEVNRIVDFAGQNAYHIISRAQSNPFCDNFYKVRDFNESWLDTQTLSSLGYSKNLREGNFFRDEWVFFNRESHSFLAKTVSKDGNFSYSTGTILPQIQDILSSLYYLRSKTLVPGQSVIVNVNTKKNWPLIVHVIRKEHIIVPAGAFDTVLVEPALRKHGIFVQKGRHLQVWMTDDAKKTPVQMQVDILFGHVTAMLLPTAPNAPNL